MDESLGAASWREALHGSALRRERPWGLGAQTDGAPLVAEPPHISLLNRCCVSVLVNPPTLFKLFAESCRARHTRGGQVMSKPASATLLFWTLPRKARKLQLGATGYPKPEWESGTDGASVQRKGSMPVWQHQIVDARLWGVLVTRAQLSIVQNACLFLECGVRA